MSPISITPASRHDCDVAYDAVQEALMRAWQNIGSLQGRSHLFTWFTRIGINEAYRSAVALRAKLDEYFAEGYV